MNVLTIAGNLGRDARLGEAGGTPVCNFTVAVRVRQKDRDTLWIDCAFWGERARKVAPYLKKGGRVAVTGELGLGGYTDNTGAHVPQITLRVNDVTLQGGEQQSTSGGGGYSPPAHQQQQRQPQQQQQADTFDTSDDVPF